MSYPTVLGPWYVVQRLIINVTTGLGEMEFYAAADDGSEMFTTKPKRAMLFMSLQSAARVAGPTAGEVRVLFSPEHAEEFGRS
jgi:hypothetical protein